MHVHALLLGTLLSGTEELRYQMESSTHEPQVLLHES